MIERILPPLGNKVPKIVANRVLVTSPDGLSWQVDEHGQRPEKANRESYLFESAIEMSNFVFGETCFAH